VPFFFLKTSNFSQKLSSLTISGAKKNEAKVFGI
jgi:hypothetical protein